jgi:dihydrolipoamide dehydrogenase
VTVSGGGGGDLSITADAIILAAGSVPRTLDGFPIDDRRIITSDELLSISELPETAVVIGGGAIG